mmetsp:Transcript_6968/g.21536  ORF Transcript_6968/g.21536 Transcript_6968/m.21536 type:complete len:292 (-) Transcript_6968:625-1500(-)
MNAKGKGQIFQPRRGGEDEGMYEKRKYAKERKERRLLLRTTPVVLGLRAVLDVTWSSSKNRRAYEDVASSLVSSSSSVFSAALALFFFFLFLTCSGANAESCSSSSVWDSATSLMTSMMSSSQSLVMRMAALPVTGKMKVVPFKADKAQRTTSSSKAVGMAAMKGAMPGDAAVRAPKAGVKTKDARRSRMMACRAENRTSRGTRYSTHTLKSTTSARKPPSGIVWYVSASREKACDAYGTSTSVAKCPISSAGSTYAKAAHTRATAPVLFARVSKTSVLSTIRRRVATAGC